MARTDILLTTDYDISCENGDFVTGDSDAQHVDLIIGSTKNSFKESPIVGVGLVNWLKTQQTNLRSMRREINVQLEADGYKPDFTVDANGDLQIGYTPKY